MSACWKCHRSIELESKISFHAACIYCGSDLHVCKNCRYYSPGKPNDCSVPNTEFVSDREKANFCEDFAIQKNHLPSQQDPLAKAKRLFGEDIPPKKNPFKD